MEWWLGGVLKNRLPPESSARSILASMVAVKPQEVFELPRGEAGVFSDFSHRKGIDRVVPRQLNDAHTIAQGDVFPLPDYLKPDFLSARSAAF